MIYKEGDRVVVKTSIHPCKLIGHVLASSDNFLRVRLEYEIRGVSIVTNDEITSIESIPVKKQVNQPKKDPKKNPFKRYVDNLAITHHVRVHGDNNGSVSIQRREEPMVISEHTTQNYQERMLAMMSEEERKQFLE